jgi:hypothetical protein
MESPRAWQKTRTLSSSPTAQAEVDGVATSYQGFAISRKSVSGSICVSKLRSGETNTTGFPDKALAFSVRANSSVVISTMQKWHRVLATHRNASLFAVQYYSSRLRFKMLLQWRFLLRKKLKMARKAREADKYLHIRRAWKLWVDKLADARRRKALQIWERRKVQAMFHRWSFVYL